MFSKENLEVLIAKKAQRVFLAEETVFVKVWMPKPMGADMAGMGEMQVYRGAKSSLSSVIMLNDSYLFEESDTWRAGGSEGDVPRKGPEAGERRGPMLISPSACPSPLG